MEVAPSVAAYCAPWLGLLALEPVAPSDFGDSPHLMGLLVTPPLRSRRLRAQWPARASAGPASGSARRAAARSRPWSCAWRPPAARSHTPASGAALGAARP